MWVPVAPLVSLTWSAVLLTADVTVMSCWRSIPFLLILIIPHNALIFENS